MVNPAPYPGRDASVRPQTFVLVHGAWHGGWCWRQVAAALRAAFGVTDPQDAAWLPRRLTPQPLHCYQQPIQLDHPLGNGLSKTYIACTRPAYEPLLPTHEWARAQQGWQYLELACGHDAMVICPEALTELLLSCT